MLQLAWICSQMGAMGVAFAVSIEGTFEIAIGEKQNSSSA